MSVKTTKLELAENVIQSLIQELGPVGFAVALSNANCHGEAFSRAGYEKALIKSDDILLRRWHAAVDEMHVVSKKLEKIQKGA